MKNNTKTKEKKAQTFRKGTETQETL